MYVTNCISCTVKEVSYISLQIRDFKTGWSGMFPWVPTFYAHSVQSISNENGMKTKILLIINSTTLR